MTINTKSIQTDLEENTQKLLHFLQKINEEAFTHKAAPEKWSLLETYDHIITMEGLIGGVFRGETVPTDRDPQEVIQKIEKAFYNYERRYTAMTPIHPQGKIQTKEAVKAALTEVRSGLIELGEERGWSQLCTAFAHPLAGTMTTAEWVYFCIIHANRHLTLMEGAVPAK